MVILLCVVLTIIISVVGMMAKQSIGEASLEKIGKIIEICMCTDLNDDGVVNTDDLLIMANAYKSHPGHEKWNLLADLDGNDLINIVDLCTVAKDYGKTV